MSEEIISVRRISSIESAQLDSEIYIQNRYDLQGKKVFLIEVVTNKSTYLIPAYRKLFKIYLGLYLKDYPFDLLKLFKKIFSSFWLIDKICISNVLTPVHCLRSWKNFSIDLSVDAQTYSSSLSKKLMSNLRYYKKKLIHEASIELRVADKIPGEYVIQYLKWKSETHGFKYEKPPSCFLEDYQINGCYALVAKSEKTLIAILFINRLNGVVYLENFAYDHAYSKYSPGKVLLYEVIQHLRANHLEYFVLGGGDDESYKADFSNRIFDVYSGFVRKTDLI